MKRAPLTCHELIDFPAAYVEHKPETEARAAFEPHLSLCPFCVDYLAG